MSLISKLAKRARIPAAAGALAFLSGCAHVQMDNTPNAYGNTGTIDKLANGVFDLATGGIFRPEQPQQIIVYTTPPSSAKPFVNMEMGLLNDLDQNGRFDGQNEIKNVQYAFSMKDKVYVATFAIVNGDVNAVLPVQYRVFNDKGEVQYVSPADFVGATKLRGISISPEQDLKSPGRYSVELMSTVDNTPLARREFTVL